jgi:hypothetical protein
MEKLALLADEFDELRRKLKSAWRHSKFAAARRIAAQGQDVFTAERADFFEQRTHFIAGVVDAGEMRQRRQLVFALDAVHNHQRFLPRAAAGAVGDGAKIRLAESNAGILSFQEAAVAFVRFRRKKFKGNDRSAGGFPSPA